MKDMSSILSGRKIQPGSQKFGQPAHEHFARAAALLDVGVVAEPKFFKKQGWFAMVPDYSLVRDDRAIFFELKRQGPRGNAHERLYKNFTQKKIRTIMEDFSLSEYPLYGVLCDSLATDNRYIRELKQNLDDENYFLWVDYNESDLAEFVDTIFARGAGISLETLDKTRLDMVR